MTYASGRLMRMSGSRDASGSLVAQKMQGGGSPLAPVTYLSRQGDQSRSIERWVSWLLRELVRFTNSPIHEFTNYTASASGGGTLATGEVAGAAGSLLISSFSSLPGLK